MTFHVQGTLVTQVTWTPDSLFLANMVTWKKGDKGSRDSPRLAAMAQNSKAWMRQFYLQLHQM